MILKSAYGLCAVFLRHILARRNAVHCFMGGPNRRRTEGSQTAGTLCETKSKMFRKIKSGGIHAAARS
jgi:hypothetical protein